MNTAAFGAKHVRGERLYNNPVSSAVRKLFDHDHDQEHEHE
jgi:hypothetical protein